MARAISTGAIHGGMRPDATLDLSRALQSGGIQPGYVSDEYTNAVSGNQNVLGTYAGGGGGGGGGGGWGPTASSTPNTNLLNAFNTQKQTIYDTSREAAAQSAMGRRSSILDFIESLQGGQRSIDERAVQNELAKKQAYGSILDMVGQGVRSGATMLASRNAVDSSASEQLARAYGKIGNRSMGEANNQYEQENRQIGLQQEDLERQRGTGLRKFEEDKPMIVNKIVSDARNQIAALQAYAAEADLPTRLELEQEVERIKSMVIGQLSEVDQLLAQSSNVKPSSQEDRRRIAFGQANAGVAPANPLEFTDQVPVEFQGTGPASGGLPLFTLPRGRREV